MYQAHRWLDAPYEQDRRESSGLTPDYACRVGQGRATFWWATPFTFTVIRTGYTGVAATVDYAVTGSGTSPATAQLTPVDHPTFARFRFSTAGGLSYAGLTPDGEVDSMPKASP